MLGLLFGSYDQNKKASKAARKAAEVERKIDERQRKREQMAVLREAQIARAQAQAASVNTGTQDSSGARGQLSSIQSQAASNVAYSNQVQTGANAIGMYKQQSADYKARSDTWAMLADLSLKATTLT